MSPLTALNDQNTWWLIAALPYVVAFIGFVCLIFPFVVAAKLNHLRDLMKAQNDLLHETLLALRMKKP